MRPSRQNLHQLPAGSQCGCPDADAAGGAQWRLNRQTHVTLADVSRLYNPVIRGWWQYCGAFYQTAIGAVPNGWTKDAGGTPFLSVIFCTLSLYLLHRQRGAQIAQTGWERITQGAKRTQPPQMSRFG